jgi:cell division protein FtsN
MKPQPYDRRKKFFFELTRSQLFLSIAGALFFLCWVFILGIVVGRGYVSDTITRAFNDQIQKLQQEKKTLMDKYLAQEKKEDIPQEEVLKPRLDFYDKLSQKETETSLMNTPKPAPKPPSSTEMAKVASPGKSIGEEKNKPREPGILKNLKDSQTASGGFLVQVGSFREEPVAQSSVKRLQEKGYQAVLRTKEIPQKGGKWFRVQVGPLKTRAEAEKMIKKMTHDGFQAIVIENRP